MQNGLKNVHAPLKTCKHVCTCNYRLQQFGQFFKIIIIYSASKGAKIDIKNLTLKKLNRKRSSEGGL